jgi:integrase
MHDKSMTNRGRRPSPRRPFAQIKHGSAVVPIYQGSVRGLTRYTVAFYLDHRRMRRTFASLDTAKAEARLAAQKIQEGLSRTNDLNPQERETYLCVKQMAQEFNTPLVAAFEEYVQCRRRLGDIPLLSAVTEFLRRTRDVKLGAKVPDVIEVFLRSKAQDKISACYQLQLKQTLSRFSSAFPGEIMHIKSTNIDLWLRGLGVSPVTRNSMLRCIKVFFSFAKTHSYLPSSEASAAELLSMVKTGDTMTEIFQPEQMLKLLMAAPSHLVPLLAIGGFAGLRAAEMERLDWTAVDLNRRIITLRADQAKTASRRIIPISENLVRWLEGVPHQGKIVSDHDFYRQARDLAIQVGINWPRNVLRHSFISYRVAFTQDVNKVALEAGNSAAVIFKHYRELVTEEGAKEWFAILPPQGWQPAERRKASLISIIRETAQISE